MCDHENLFFFRTLFDKETYFGFIVCLMVQLCAYIPWTLAFVAPLLLYMGLCSYVVAHATDLKTIFIKLNDQVLLNRYASKKSTMNAIDPNAMLNEILKEAVNTHRDIIKYELIPIKQSTFLLQINENECIFFCFQ